jgi:DnaJ homolog subfamily C member 28
MTDKPANDDARDDAHPLRRAVTNRTFENVVDQLLGKARAEGQFDKLEGTGRPIRPDVEEALVPEDMRAGYRMLKNAGFAPPWVEARRSLDKQRGELAGWLAQANNRWRHLDDAGRAKLRAEYKRRLEDLQREILNYNLTAPESAGQVPGLRIPLELEKLGGGT